MISFKNLRFGTGRTGGAGQRVIDEMLERRFAVRVARIFNLRDDLGQKRRIVDRLGAQALFFAGFNLFKISVIKAHGSLAFSY
jgi:hypothetical protein